MGMSFTVTVFFLQPTQSPKFMFSVKQTDWAAVLSYSVHSVNIPSSPCIVFSHIFTGYKSCLQGENCDSYQFCIGKVGVG